LNYTKRLTFWWLHDNFGKLYELVKNWINIILEKKTGKNFIELAHYCPSLKGC